MLEALARLTGTGVVVIDPDGKPTFASRTALENLELGSFEELCRDWDGWSCVEGRFPDLRFESQWLDGGQRLVLIASRAHPPARDADLLLARRTRVTGEIERLVAHDLRAPLNAIQLGVELLDGAIDDAGARTEPGSRHLAVIREEIMRMSRLIEQRLEGPDPMTSAASFFDLRDLVVETSRLSLGALRTAGARMRSDLPEGPMPARGARDRLRLALLEVLVQCAHDASNGDCLTLVARREGASLLVTVEARAPKSPADLDAMSCAIVPCATEPGAGLCAAGRLLGMQQGSLAVERLAGDRLRYELRIPAETPASPAVAMASPPTEEVKVRITG